MANKLNQKVMLDVLKSIGIAAGGTIASGMVAKLLDEKVLKVDATTTGLKAAASGIACTALGMVGAIKAKESWQKDFSKGFAIGGAYRVIKKGVPRLNLAGLEGGGYYDQYGNYVAGVDEMEGYEEIGLAPVSAASNLPELTDWRGEDYSFQPALPMISGIEAPSTSDGYYNDGTSTVPALLGTDTDNIL